jgi:hypothetical protein
MDDNLEKNRDEWKTEALQSRRRIKELHQELAEERDKNKRFKDMADIVVFNAVIGPDSTMNGTTDCYHVPIDDIDKLSLLWGARGGEETYP